jgi:hypothetical protein
MNLLEENLLEIALGVIPGENFIYRRFLGTVENEIGLNVPQFAEPIEVTGSIQGVELDVYSQLGLDFQKNYRLVYASIDMKGIEEQEIPDRLEFYGLTWSVVKTVPWVKYNGWNGVLVVEDKRERL